MELIETSKLMRTQNNRSTEKQELIRSIKHCIEIIKASGYDAPRTQIEIHHIEQHLDNIQQL